LHAMLLARLQAGAATRTRRAGPRGVALGAVLALGLAQAVQARAAPDHTVPDTMSQRALACTQCHGPQGRASAEGYVPRLAGKPADYLTAQLRHFRDGRRPHGAMARLLHGLPDEYLAEFGAYFAAQRVPMPATPAGPMPGAASVERATTLVRHGRPGVPACAACHGDRLTGVAPAVPGLLGLPRDYLVAQLGGWREGVRRADAPDCMAQVARALAPEEVTALADWLAAQPVPGDGLPDDGPRRPWPLACGGVPGEVAR
ncbi:MAG: c-type cytochrome, partial [Rubrivivax sp.]